MARAALTPQAVVPGGLAVNLTGATADGDSFAAGRVMLYVLNGDDQPIVVTAVTPVTVQSLAVQDAGGSVPAGSFRLFGPFPRSVYGQPYGEADEGKVYVNYSSVDSVTRALISI